MGTSHIPVRADLTALLFPTGGYLWPGMGSDLEGTRHGALLDRIDATLGTLGVAEGALRRLMAGDGQARRARCDGGWVWTGDFPLSMVAQMALGIALARELVERHGAPCVLVGESMGEIAAYCAAEALSLEEATLLTYRWAKDLQSASDALGLRMAVVEDLDENELAELALSLQSQVVVAEAAHLFVVALPASNLDALDREVSRRGGRILVSNNPCAAHEPRLAGQAETWRAHERFLEKLAFRAPALPLISTLAPGQPLSDPGSLRRNRVDTTFMRVRWDETLALLPSLGVRDLVQLGPISSAYSLKKLRSEDTRLAHVRVHVVATLAAVQALPARPPPPPSISPSTRI
jgi:malonyl CoA-acyl carrier protein transacylase